MKRYECKMVVGLVLIKDTKILLMKRYNTGFEDGMFEFASGHIEKGESLTSAMVREAKEEIGIDIDQSDLKLINVHYSNSGENYIHFFFICDKYSGQVRNCETNKCSEIKWFDINNLPQNIGGIANRVISSYKNGIILDEYGW